MKKIIMGLVLVLFLLSCQVSETEITAKEKVTEDEQKIIELGKRHIEDEKLEYIQDIRDLITSPKHIGSECKDSDGDKKIYEQIFYKGVTEIGGKNYSDSLTIIKPDKPELTTAEALETKLLVVEYYCDENEGYQKIFECPDGFYPMNEKCNVLVSKADFPEKLKECYGFESGKCYELPFSGPVVYSDATIDENYLYISGALLYAGDTFILKLDKRTMEVKEVISNKYQYFLQLTSDGKNLWTTVNVYKKGRNIVKLDENYLPMEKYFTVLEKPGESTNAIIAFAWRDGYIIYSYNGENDYVSTIKAPNIKQGRNLGRIEVPSKFVVGIEDSENLLFVARGGVESILVYDKWTGKIVDAIIVPTKYMNFVKGIAYYDDELFVVDDMGPAKIYRFTIKDDYKSKCIDSDGDNPLIKGSVETNYGSHTDQCITSRYLLETNCKGYSGTVVPDADVYACNCEKGICNGEYKKVDLCIDITCTDIIMTSAGRDVYLAAKQFVDVAETIADYGRERKEIEKAVADYYNEQVNVGENEEATYALQLVRCGEMLTTTAKNLCYLEVALETKDSNVCDKMTEDRQENCYVRVSDLRKDLKSCKKLTRQDLKDYCYSNVAVAEKNIAICNEFVSKNSLKQDDCYSKLAKELKDLSVCGKVGTYDSISGNYRKDLCTIGVASVTKDLSACDKIIKEINNVDCLNAVAKVTQDASICDSQSDLKSKDQCYYIVALEQKDSSKCDMMSNQDSIDNCYMYVAEKQGDHSLCANIKGNKTKDDCFVLVASHKLDLNICSQIVDSDSKQKCYLYVAIGKGDFSICEDLEDQWKESCIATKEELEEFA